MIGIGPNISVQPSRFVHKSGASLEYDFLAGTMSPISGNEAITFTRASAIATAVNELGLIYTAAANQPRLNHDVNVIAQQNLVIYAGEFDNAAWIKNAATITANSVKSPSGAIDGDTFTATAGSGSHEFDQNFTATAAPYTMSMRAKAGTASWLGLSIDTQVQFAGAFFNLTTGVVGQVASGGVASMLYEGDGWYRCFLTRTLTAGSRAFVVEVHTADAQAINWTAAGTENIYISAAQATVATGHGSRELVSNGTFDTATTGWTAGGGATLSAVNGQLKVLNDATGTNRGYAYQAITTVAGRAYKISASQAGGTTSQAYISIGTTSSAADIFDGFTSTLSTVFTALGTTTYIRVTNSTAASVYGNFDNVTVKELNYLPYTPTTSAVATVKYACRGMLIEEARENKLTKSQEFDNGNWSKSTQTITANSVAGPDGSVVADTINVPAGTGSKYIFQGFTATAAAHTLSVFAKAGTTNWIGLAFNTNAINDGAFFNLSAGVVGTIAAGSSATIENFGNGWYRCCLTRTRSAGSDGFEIELHTADNQGTTFNAAGTETIYIFGAQAELGAFATSYIPTTTAAVTRAQDIAYVSNVTPWYNPTEGTIFFEGDDAGYVSFPQVQYCLGDLSTANEILCYAYDNKLTSAVVAASSSQAGFESLPFVPNVPYKLAHAFKANDFGVSLNGGAAQSDVSGSMPTGVVRLNLGARFDNSLPKTGHIRKFAIYPRRFPAAELEMLTA